MSTAAAGRSVEATPPRALLFIVAALPLVLGGTAPIANRVNLVWGSIYGFPGCLFHNLRVPHPLPVDLLWVLVWPALVTWAVVRLTKRAWRLPAQMRTALLALYLLSLCVLVSMDGVLTAAPGESFEYENFPLYVRLLVY